MDLEKFLRYGSSRGGGVGQTGVRVRFTVNALRVGDCQPQLSVGCFADSTWRAERSELMLATLPTERGATTVRPEDHFPFFIGEPLITA
jgi:hypothetical protein